MTELASRLRAVDPQLGAAKCWRASWTSIQDARSPPAIELTQRAASCDGRGRARCEQSRNLSALGFAPVRVDSTKQREVVAGRVDLPPPILAW